jgi:DNA-nicking Smr family endonuclease
MEPDSHDDDIHSKQLRFDIGQNVVVRVENEEGMDRWIPGMVVQHWPKRDVSYAIGFRDGSELYEESDIDYFIRENIGTCDFPRYKLRFDVGHEVYCRISPGSVTGWEPGIVIKLWYRNQDDEMAPYCVLLDDGRTVSVLNDHDPTIRAKGTRLRFGIGHRISCNVEGCSQLLPGTVTQLWPSGGATYRILLDNGNIVWAPDDCDFFVSKLGDPCDSKDNVAEVSAPCSRKAKKKNKRRQKNASKCGRKEKSKSAPRNSKKQNNYSEPSYKSEDSDRVKHSKLLSLVFEEASLLFQERRQRLNNLATKKCRPKQKSSKVKAYTPESINHNCSFPDVEVKAGTSGFHVLVGHEEFLYKSSKSSKHVQVTPQTIDLHGCTRDEAISKLNRSLTGWMNDAMKEYPWTLAVNIIVGGGAQLVSEAVEHWIREQRHVAKRFT